MVKCSALAVDDLYSDELDTLLLVSLVTIVTTERLLLYSEASTLYHVFVASD